MKSIPSPAPLIYKASLKSGAFFMSNACAIRAVKRHSRPPFPAISTKVYNYLFLFIKTKQITLNFKIFI